MSIYTAFDNPGRGLRYMKDGRLIAKDKLPEHVISAIKPGEELDDNKLCVFCGTPSNLSRNVGNKMVAVCQEHFYSKNIGQIAQVIRETENAKVNA